MSLPCVGDVTPGQHNDGGEHQERNITAELLRFNCLSRYFPIKCCAQLCAICLLAGFLQAMEPHKLSTKMDKKVEQMNFKIIVSTFKGTCQKRFSGFCPLRGGGYPPIPLRKKPAKNSYFWPKNANFSPF